MAHMSSHSNLSRRQFIALTAAAASCRAAATPATALAEFGYGDVTIISEPHEAQLRNTHEVLMRLSEDSLLRPFRQMAGQPAPGADLGGWYNYDPDFDWRKQDAGFAPGATFGQWISALARYYAITGSAETRAKVLRLNRLYAQTISENFYDANRFPAYCYDKLVLGLIDSQRWVGDTDAFATLEATTRAAVPHLHTKAIASELEWRPGKDQSFCWVVSFSFLVFLFLVFLWGV